MHNVPKAGSTASSARLDAASSPWRWCVTAGSLRIHDFRTVRGHRWHYTLFMVDESSAATSTCTLHGPTPCNDKDAACSHTSCEAADAREPDLPQGGQLLGVSRHPAPLLYFIMRQCKQIIQQLSTSWKAVSPGAQESSPDGCCPASAASASMRQGEMTANFAQNQNKQFMK